MKKGEIVKVKETGILVEVKQIYVDAGIIEVQGMNTTNGITHKYSWDELEELK